MALLLLLMTESGFTGRRSILFRLAFPTVHCSLLWSFVTIALVSAAALLVLFILIVVRVVAKGVAIHFIVLVSSVSVTSVVVTAVRVVVVVVDRVSDVLLVTHVVVI